MRLDGDDSMRTIWRAGKKHFDDGHFYAIAESQSRGEFHFSEMSQIESGDWSSNNALDPTAVSVSDFMRFDFSEYISIPDRAVPAVGQLGR